jgi:hypothetical protein
MAIFCHAGNIGDILQPLGRNSKNFRHPSKIMRRAIYLL